MAYPTTLAYVISGQFLGAQPIAATSTTQNHPLGFRIRAVDATYGEGEFIYLKGVASTAAGDVVTYDTKGAATVRTVAASRGPMAVAMSANVASQYGWYQILGSAVVSTASAGTGAANSLLAVTATPGQATVSGGAGVKISGALCKTAQDTPTSGFTAVQLHYPAANGDT